MALQAQVPVSIVRRFTPKENGSIIIDLPGERTRGTVLKVVDSNTVVAELTSILMSRSHFYKKGQMVGVRRQSNELGECWVCVDEHQLRTEELASRLAAETPPAPEPTVDAADLGQQPGREKPKHPRTHGKRKAAKTGGGNRAVKRKAPSK